MSCVTSAGTPAQGTYIMYGDCGSPETYVPVSGVMTITGPEVTLGEIETTNHGTPTATQVGKTYRPTLPEPGTISFPIVWNGADVTHQALETMQSAKEVRRWRLQESDPSNRTKQFEGFVQKIGSAFDPSGIIMRNVTLRLTTVPHYV